VNIAIPSLSSLSISEDENLHVLHSLVQIPKPVLMATESAVGRRLCVVHAVSHRSDGSQVGEDRFQVVICEIAEVTPRHDGRWGPGFHLPSADDLNELLLVKIGNAGRIRREVERCHLYRLTVRSKWSTKHLTTSKLHARNQVAVSIMRGVASLAMSTGYEVLPVAGSIGPVWLGYWFDRWKRMESSPDAFG
jgi:hypothetical protein